MAIALDASTPAFKATGTAATTAVSNSFSPPAGSVIVVGIANMSDDVALSSVSDSLGSHLTWAKIANYLDVTDGGAWEFWWAFVASAPGSMTVTGTWAGAKNGYSQPMVFTGAASSQSGNASTSGRNATGAAVSQSITSTAAGSVGAMLFYNNSGTALTPGTNQTITLGGSSSYDTASGVNQATMLLTTPAGALGSTITLNTAVSGGVALWAALTVEILAAAAGSPTVHPGRVVSQAATRASTY